MKRTQQFRTLSTPFESGTFEGWNIHPRPQFKRDSWLSLCGTWRLSVLSGEHESDIGPIRVPFVPESRLSGIERTLETDECWVYRRRFALPTDFNRGRILLHFGAVDAQAKVLVNGANAGSHVGGYLPFTLDITQLVHPGDNDLCVIVADTLDPDIPYGKQRRRRGGMWYTPFSGIWQPVWLESVPQEYIHTLRITPTLDAVTFETAGGTSDKCITIHTDTGDLVHRYTGNRVTLPIPSPRHWTPEEPYLYRFELTCGEDRIESYFALRTIGITRVRGQAYLALNGKPYFFHGLLDQGYFSDGICLPASPEGYRRDVLTMKELGFNMLRKHIKVEPELFYYYCDLYGMVVFQDMVNSGPYSFLLDTALPTVGLKRGISHAASPRRRSLFEEGAADTVQFLYNHPCVCYYTIFNEGWGQYDADDVYERLKALDTGRIWDTTSGWFTEEKSDVRSEHIYFRPLKFKLDFMRPLVLSEFGGYVCKIPDHSFNPDKTYGYRICSTQEDFARDMAKLYREELIPALRQGLCASVLTQLSDVEDETNGLFTYDRQVVKVSRDFMAGLSAELFAAFERQVNR